MTSLNTLLLEYNNFNGQVPEILLQRNKSSDLYLDVAGNPLLCLTVCPGPVHKKTSHWALIFGSLAAFFGLLAACYVVVRARRSNTQTTTNITARPSLQNVIGHTELVERSNVARVYSYHEIETATDNFRAKLGEGGFGHVYHGTLRSGVVVAVKVLSDDSRQGKDEFLNEVGVLSQVHHKNLVRLIGYCIERKLVLVHEYMPRGALRESLHGRGILLDWRTRLSIALDAAQGLEYLHGGCSPQIIHRDVKSSNILLNDTMEAKLGDFGISKAIRGAAESGTSTSVRGTPGYIDPNYVNFEVASENIDIYAFGVVLFEIVSGRPALWKNPQSGQSHILEWAIPLLQQGRIDEMVDNKIAMEYNASTLWKVGELAMMCVDSNSNMRPTMREVCVDLRQAIQMEFERKEIEKNASSDLANCSLSTTGIFTVTHVQAR